MRRGILRACDLMKSPVLRLRIETPICEAVDFLLRHQISGAPVEDKRGHWKGVFEMNDIARGMAARLGSLRMERSLEVRERVPEVGAPSVDEWGSLQVAEVMTPWLVTVTPGAPLREVLRSLLLSRVHRVFVLPEAGAALEGVITTTDVIQCLHLDGATGSELHNVDSFGESPGRGARLIRSSARR